MNPELVASDRWISLALLAPYLLYLLVRTGHYLVLLVAGRQLPFDQDVADKGTTALIGFHLRQIFVWSAEPVYRLLARSRVSPNLLTLICLVLSVAAACTIVGGSLAIGGAVGLVGSSFDYFDGRVARKTGRTSRAGNFLDSTLDRWCDIAFLGGAAVLFREQVALLVASIVALGSSLVISYTRAKAESLGGDLKVGIMQRPERVVVFCLGALLDPWIPSPPWQDHATFAAAILVLALFTLLTAVRRTIVGMRVLMHEERDD